MEAELELGLTLVAPIRSQRLSMESTFYGDGDTVLEPRNTSTLKYSKVKTSIDLGATQAESSKDACPKPSAAAGRGNKNQQTHLFLWQTREKKSKTNGPISTRSYPLPRIKQKDHGRDKLGCFNDTGPCKVGRCLPNTCI